MEKGPGGLQVKYPPGNFPKKNWKVYLNSSFNALEQAFSTCILTCKSGNGLPALPPFLCLLRVALSRSGGTEGENPSWFLPLGGRRAGWCRLLLTGAGIN